MSTAEERAKARASWPVRKTTLEEETDVPVSMDAQTAWRAVLELTRETFATAGALPPRLPRSQWPSTIIRPGGDDGA